MFLVLCMDLPVVLKMKLVMIIHKSKYIEVFRLTKEVYEGYSTLSV